MKLEDAKVVVTGAASGMGRQFALEFAAAGAAVAACDVNDEGLASLAEEASALPGTVRTYNLNVADEAAVTAFFDQAWADFGGLNGLVNNAGIFRDGLLVKPDKATGGVKRMSLRNWQMVLDVDLTGPFLCTRELAARIIENEGGPAVVVNISSISRSGNMGQSNYSAAKAGLVADTVIWAKELRGPRRRHRPRLRRHAHPSGDEARDARADAQAGPPASDRHDRRDLCRRALHLRVRLLHRPLHRHRRRAPPVARHLQTRSSTAETGSRPFTRWAATPSSLARAISSEVHDVV